MDYFAAFDISASGMEVQKIRVDTVALNLANVSTTRSASGGPYQPLEVIVGERTAQQFENMMHRFRSQYRGAEVIDIVAQGGSPRLVHNPEHPDADSNGMVAYPDVNPVSEMVNLMDATRAYEANVRAINAPKAMALEALDIGRR